MTAVALPLALPTWLASLPGAHPSPATRRGRRAKRQISPSGLDAGLVQGSGHVELLLIINQVTREAHSLGPRGGGRRRTLDCAVSSESQRHKAHRKAFGGTVT